VLLIGKVTSPARLGINVTSRLNPSLASVGQMSPIQAKVIFPHAIAC